MFEKKELALTILGLLFAVAAFISFYAGIGTKYLPIGCNGNYLCENKYTKALEGLNDRWEGGIFKCYKSDCCFIPEIAYDTCVEHVRAYYTKVYKKEGKSESEINEMVDKKIKEICGEEKIVKGEKIYDKKKINPNNIAALTHCYLSNKNCFNSTCIQSCNLNGICEEGEYILCEDCWKEKIFGVKNESGEK